MPEMTCQHHGPLHSAPHAGSVTAHLRLGFDLRGPALPRFRPSVIVTCQAITGCDGRASATSQGSSRSE